MRRLSVLVIVVALASAALLSPAEAAKGKGKARSGVFGTINGKSFGASNLLGSGDSCMFGIYQPATQTLTFQALECKPKRRRQGVAMKKNFQLLLISCLRADASAPVATPPFEMPCPFSLYEENTTGRFGLPISKTQWGPGVIFNIGPPITTESNVHVRVDSFDGTIISGAIFGTFTEPVSGPGSEIPAAISGEMQFSFPIQVQ
jgi:hypothetical protein